MNSPIRKVKRNEKVLAKIESWLVMCGIENFGTECLAWEYSQWEDFNKQIMRNNKRGAKNGD